MQRAVMIRGRIQPAGADHASAMLRRTGPAVSRQQSGMHSINVADDGSFSMEVLPGTYTISASDRSGRVASELTVDARANIDGLELTLGQGYEINGRVVVDGAAQFDFSKLNLQFFGGPVK